VSLHFRNSKRGVHADLAFYAPLVLLPFAWFVTGACMELIDGTTPAGLSNDDNTGRSIYQLPTGETRYVGPGGSGGDIYCVGGTYRGGGPGSSDAIKNGLRNEIDAAKRKVKDFEGKINACRGKVKSIADFEREAGCNWNRMRELGGQIVNATSAAEAQRLQGEQDTINANCRTARLNYLADPCSDTNYRFNQDMAGFWRDQVAHKENQLKQFEACDGQRQQQARPQRPGIDPAIILMTPGLFGPPPRRPQGGHGTGTHKE
jgi:hypothetical protein